MTTARERLLEKERRRYRVLRALYDQTDGTRFARVMPLALVESTGLELDEVDRALEYLDGEGLTKVESLSGTRSIAHRGVVEIEQTIRAPETATAHFSEEVVQALATEDEPADDA